MPSFTLIVFTNSVIENGAIKIRLIDETIKKKKKKKAEPLGGGANDYYQAPRRQLRESPRS